MAVLDPVKIVITNYPEGTVEMLTARNNPENSHEKYISYMDASTYGTNDKEKRQRRFKILSTFFQEINLSDTEING